MNDKAPRRKIRASPPSAPTADSVGGALRQRRQMRGQSLDAVYQATRIPRNLLQALEEDRFADFPAPVYMRSFLKTYCEYLELEFEPFWQRAAPPPRTPEEAEQEEDRQPSAPDGQEPPPWLSARLVLAAALLVLALFVWGAVRLLGARKDRAEAATPVAEQAPAVPAPAEPAAVPAATEFTGPAAAPTPAPPAAAAPAADRNRLVVTALADGWVSLRRDGQLVFEGRLPGGKHLDYRGASFELHTSDPAGLSLELGGEPLLLSAVKPEHDGGFRFVPR